jgi:hypothetical protein
MNDVCNALLFAKEHKALQSARLFSKRSHTTARRMRSAVVIDFLLSRMTPCVN